MVIFLFLVNMIGAIMVGLPAIACQIGAHRRPFSCSEEICLQARQSPSHKPTTPFWGCIRYAQCQGQARPWSLTVDLLVGRLDYTTIFGYVRRKGLSAEMDRCGVLVRLVSVRQR